MEHNHSVYDTDTHFVIVKDTREIKCEAESLPVIVQHDHNSERFSFRIDRLIDGHDMTRCNQIKVHYINIDSTTRDTAKGVYRVDDIAVLDGDASKAVFSWLISENATQYAGKLSFKIEFACVADDGTVTYRWNTAIYSEVTVSNGMDNGEAVTEAFPDILAQWEAELFVIGDNAERSKAPAIVLSADGKSIVVHDASDCYLRGLRVFGKSTQDGTPTPDAPVEIVSVEEHNAIVCGKNLMNPNGESFTNRGVTFTNNGDGSFTVKGTSTGAVGFGLTNLDDFPVRLCGGVAYTQSVVILSGDKSAAIVVPSVKDNDGNVKYNYLTDNQTKTAEKDYTIYTYTLYMDAGITVDCTFRVQLEIGGVATPWENYKTHQTVTVPHTLHGIPVTSGGNYTDANGQQWICDEVDLGRGVYVQRVHKLQLDAVTKWYRSSSTEHFQICCDLSLESLWNNALSSHYRVQTAYSNENKPYIRLTDGGVLLYYEDTLDSFASIDEWKSFLAEQASVGTPVEVLYTLANPIETPLSDAEIAAFKALHSNFPNTTVLNDADAHMAIEYVADTKTYIDNKLGS